MSTDRITEEAIALWRAHGGGAGPITASPCAAGGNNRLLLLDNARQRVVAKAYYRGTSDGSERLKAEWSFLHYALDAGVTNVARPIAADPTSLLALFDYVSGRKLTAKEVGEAEVRAAASFVRTLNSAPETLRKSAANALPRAGDSAFSFQEYFATLERRIRRLEHISPDTTLDREALAFAQEIRAVWTVIQVDIESMAKKLGISLEDKIDSSEIVISPSDFGFHNALLTENGHLCFIDFEYAGFDDIAKLVCDFFLQPEIPVDIKYFDIFFRGVAAGSTERQMKRVETLYPIFALKWCCIMLNCFIRDRVGRIRHANPGCDVDDRKTTQLAKARLALQELRCHSWPISISFP